MEQVNKFSEKEEEKGKMKLDYSPKVISRYGPYARIRRGDQDYIEYPVNHPDRAKPTMEGKMTASAHAFLSWDPSSMMPPRPDTPEPPKRTVKRMTISHKKSQERKQDVAKELEWQGKHAEHRGKTVKKKQDILAAADEVLKTAVKATYRKADGKRDRGGEKKVASTSKSDDEKPAKKQKKGTSKARNASGSPSS